METILVSQLHTIDQSRPIIASSMPRIHRSVIPVFLLFFVFTTINSCTPSRRHYSVAGGIESITRDDLQRHLSYLASDELQGRDTGKPGLERAASYIADELSRMRVKPAGNDNSYFQSFSLTSRQLTDRSQITVIGDDGREQIFAFRRDFFPLPNGLTKDLWMEGNPVFAGFGIRALELGYDDYAGIEVKDRIVIIMTSEPQAEDDSSPFDGKSLSVYGMWKSKIQNAKELNVKALIIVDYNIADAAAFAEQYGKFAKYIAEPKMTLQDTDIQENELPLVLIAGATMGEAMLAGSSLSLAQARAQIDSTLQPVSFAITQKQIRIKVAMEMKKVSSSNVIGVVTGSDKNLRDEVVVYSAHYDHVGMDGDSLIYNGADDDASGSSALLELADAYAQASTKPRRSVMFIWFTAEEKGLLGSLYYTQQPTIPLNQTVANINIDMIGRVRAPDDHNPKNAGLAGERTVYVVGGHQSAELMAINEEASRDVGLVLDYTFNDINHPKKVYYRSDHYNFARRGVPVLFFTTGEHADYHEPTDTADKIDFAKLQKTTSLAFITGWRVADRKKRIEVVKLANTQ